MNFFPKVEKVSFFHNSFPKKIVRSSQRSLFSQFHAFDFTPRIKKWRDIGRKKTEHSELIILTICGASEESKRFVSHLVRNLVSFNKTRQLELVKIVVLFFRFYCPENSETNVALSRSSMPPLFSLRKHTFSH